MHLFFVDESGCIPKKGKENEGDYFTLGGIVIPEDVWFKVSRDLKSLKEKYGVAGEIKWRYFYDNSKDPTNSLKKLTSEQRKSLRVEIYNLIVKYESIKLICACADISKAYRLGWVHSEEDIYCETYKKATERFQYYLQDVSKVFGTEVNGLVICDPRSNKSDNHLRLLHNSMLGHENKYYSNYKNLVEGLFFAPSHLSPGIQLADMVTGATSFHMKGKDYFFDIIKDRYRANKNKQINGFGIATWPKNK